MKLSILLVVPAALFTASLALGQGNPPAATPALAAKGGPPGFQFHNEKTIQREADFYTGNLNKSTLCKVGDAAPDFTCQTISGEAFSLGKERGKVLLVTFIANGLETNVADILRLEKDVAAKVRDHKDFKFLTIGTGQDTSALQQLATGKRITQPLAADPDKEIFAKFATANAHRSFIIGKDGKIKLSVGPTVIGVMKEGQLRPVIAGYSEATFQEISRTLLQELAAPPKG